MIASRLSGGFLPALALLCATISGAHAQIDPANLSAEERARIDEHVYGGLPGVVDVYVRQGYVLGYNPETRTPNWTAYRITRAYRQTPAREGRFETFRSDPDVDGEPSDADYRGLFDSRGYARGHLAPYAVMGGDRDGDGTKAQHLAGDSSNVGDPDDARTVFEGNYMSNIAPQHHEGFNGGATVSGRYVPGLWYELERWVQDDLVLEQGREVWEFSGCIFGPGEHERVGPNHDIWVPPLFYKIVIFEERGRTMPVVLAFLFPHQRARHGDLSAFLTSVDVIEALSGLNFFRELDDLTEARLEDLDTWLTWKERW